MTVNILVHDSEDYISAFRIACAKVAIRHKDYHSAVLLRSHERETKHGQHRVYRFTFLVS